MVNYYLLFNLFNVSVFQGYITPSLTTFSNLNPGYRVYKIDGYYPGSSYWVLDHRTVIMNLTATNMYNRTIFVDEYDARDAYQMENLFPADWNNLIERLLNDIDGPLMGLVYQYYTKSNANETQCNHDCRRGLLCDFITGRSEDPHACDRIPA
jgi:sphingomyelin phosphodiesterase